MNPNTAVGCQTLINNTTGSENVGVGYLALNQNVAGINNTAVGSRAMSLGTTGNNNVAVGWSSLLSNVSGTNCIAIGSLALSSNTTGIQNVCMGSLALQNNTTGANNVAVGYLAMQHSVSSTENTACGSGTMTALTTGIQNTCFGTLSLNVLTTTNNNTGIGYNALSGVVTGTNNTALGSNAGELLTGSDSHNIYVSNPGVTGENNTMRLGTGGVHTKNYQAGIFGVALNGTGIPVLVDNTNQLGTIASSRHLKQNIVLLDDVQDIIAKLEPCTFSFISDSTNKKVFGMIAEDVEKLVPEIIVVLDPETNTKTIKYDAVNIMLIKEVQRLQKEVKDIRSLLK